MQVLELPNEVTLDTGSVGVLNHQFYRLLLMRVHLPKSKIILNGGIAVIVALISVTFHREDIIHQAGREDLSEVSEEGRFRAGREDLGGFRAGRRGRQGGKT